MSDPQSSLSLANPRRRPLGRSALPSLDTSFRLKKSATFHVSSPAAENLDDDVHPRLNLPGLLRRSPTGTRSLEDVIAAGEKRMAAVIGSLERSLSGLGSTTTKVKEEELPVPRGILDANIPTDREPCYPATDRKLADPRRRRSHSLADSGIGSSISSEQDIKPHLPGPKECFRPLQSAVTGSVCPESEREEKPTLSAFAFKKIELLIIRPLYKSTQFVAFRPFLKGIPSLVLRNRIQCLRDLEKYFIFSSRAFAPSKSAYTLFCEYAVHCLHTAVSHVPRHEHTRPGDRPYTNGYFLTLVEQIRHYAATYNTGDQVVVEGGLAKTGRPVELVRKTKEGELVSLRTGQKYDQQPRVPAMKRSLSNTSIDEGVARAMARRKKGEPPMDINKKCEFCDRVFRRPCDLTKHEKTHTRPWKCNMEDCDFAKKGFATEKERDRHWNDRHDPNPTWYYCQYQGCAYGSKRESNCKQHMEKSHGYGYIRTKQSGKRAEEQKKHAAMSKSPTSIGLQTPQVNHVPTPSPLMANTPNFPPVATPILSPYQYGSLEPSPAMPTPLQPDFNDYDVPLFADAQPAEYGNYDNAMGNNNLTINDYNFNPAAVNTGMVNNGVDGFPNSDTSPFQQNRPSSDIDLPSLDLDTLTLPSSGNSINGVSPTFNPVDFGMDYTVNWPRMDDDVHALAMLPTPQASPNGYGMDASPNASKFSPNGKGNLMFYGPDEGHDGSYGGQSMAGGKDWPLYSDDTSALPHGSHGENPNVAYAGSMFQPLQSVHPQTVVQAYNMFAEGQMSLEDLLQMDNDTRMKET